MGSRQRREEREARRWAASGEPPEPAEWDTPEWRARNVETNRMLIANFPELEEVYRREILSIPGWEENGGHVIYSEIFYPFIDHALRTEPDISPLLDRIFDFVNMLAESGESDRMNLAEVGIGEFLALEDGGTLRELALPRLGPKMRSAIDQALT